MDMSFELAAALSSDPAASQAFADLPPDRKARFGAWSSALQTPEARRVRARDLLEALRADAGRRSFARLDA